MIETKSSITCARHPKTETSLRCSSCSTAICPGCLVQTPVGMKCRACASHRQGSLFRPSPGQIAAASVAGLTMGIIVGWAVEFGGIFIIFLAFAFGGFAGEAVLRAGGRRRGKSMEIVTALSMVTGALGGRILIGAIQLASSGYVHPPYGVLNVIVDLILPTPIPLAAIVIAVIAAVSRIKYL